MRDNDKILRLNARLQDSTRYSQEVTVEIDNIDSVLKFSKEQGRAGFKVRYYPGGSQYAAEKTSSVITDFFRDESYALLVKAQDELRRLRENTDKEIIVIMKELKDEMEGKPRTKKVTVKEILIYDDVEVPSDLEGQALEDFTVDQLAGHEVWHVEERFITE